MFSNWLYGADSGAAASLNLNDKTRINYDGKVRPATQSHRGTLGVEFKW